MTIIKKLLKSSRKYSLNQGRFVFIKTVQNQKLPTAPTKLKRRNIRLNPRPYDYTYLLIKSFLKTINKFAQLVNHGYIDPIILDLGCGQKPFQSLFPRGKFIGVDFDLNSDAEVIADNHRLPFKDNSFDAIIASEVLEHSADEYQFIKEMRRVAKKNALVYISLPFIFPLHGVPHDFNRFTKYKLNNLFKDDKIIFLEASNNIFASVFIFINMVIRILFGSAPLFYPVYAVNNLLALAAENFSRLYRDDHGFIAEYWQYALTAFPIGYSMIVKIKK